MMCSPILWSGSDQCSFSCGLSKALFWGKKRPLLSEKANGL
jgi:hypothetical protein